LTTNRGINGLRSRFLFDHTKASRQ
jgi:hypothetical protein